MKNAFIIILYVCAIIAATLPSVLAPFVAHMRLYWLGVVLLACMNALVFLAPCLRAVNVRRRVRRELVESVLSGLARQLEDTPENLMCAKRSRHTVFGDSQLLSCLAGKPYHVGRLSCLDGQVSDIALPTGKDCYETRSKPALFVAFPVHQKAGEDLIAVLLLIYGTAKTFAEQGDPLSSQSMHRVKTALRLLSAIL